MLYSFVKKFKGKFKAIKGAKLRILLALMLGGVCTKILDKVIEKLYMKLYGLEELQILDHMFLYDTARNPANAVVFVETSKFKYEEFWPKFADLYDMDLPRNKSKLVMVGGRHYFKKMNENEWREKR